MEIVQMQVPDEKPTTTLLGMNIISPEFAGANKNSGLATGDGAKEQRRLERVQEEKNMDECTTMKGEPSQIMDPPICLPPLTIKIQSREFADEKEKNPIVVDGEGAKEERPPERTTELEEKDECTTPKGQANRIPAPTVCPPPPGRRFKRPTKPTTEIPPEKYFPVPADLTSVFIPLKKIRTS